MFDDPVESFWRKEYSGLTYKLHDMPYTLRRTPDP